CGATLILSLLLHSLNASGTPLLVCHDRLTFHIEDQRQALEILRQTLPRLQDGEGLQSQQWYQLLENFSLPHATAPSPLLLLSMLGVGNAGKSTLMNAIPSLILGQRHYLLNQPVTRVGRRPGITARMVIAVGGEADAPVLTDLQQRFGDLKDWSSVDES